MSGIKRKICKRLRIFAYKVQLLSDLTTEEFNERLLKTWQAIDYAFWILASAAAGDRAATDVLAKYWGPSPPVSYWQHVVLVFFDHVPQWFKRTDERVMQEFQTRKSQRLAGHGGVVTHTRGGGAAEKWRVTTVMAQCVIGWFDSSRDPIGVTLPTILIVYGSEACLEDIPTASEMSSPKEKARFKAGPHQGETVHSGLMKTWRELRDDNKLVHLNDKIRVWQHPNTYLHRVAHTPHVRHLPAGDHHPQWRHL